MPIDPRIALGFKPTYELESPQNIEANVMKLQNAKYANELARMQSQEYSRGMQEQEGLRNYLAGNPDLNSSEGVSNAMRFGKSGLGVLESAAKLKKEKTEAQGKSEDVISKIGVRYKSALDAAESPAQLAAVHSAMFNDETLGPVLKAMGRTPDSGLAAIQNSKTPEEFYALKLKMGEGTAKFLDASKSQILQQVSGTGTRMVAFNPLTNQLSVVPGSESQAANAAPTLTTIVDPTNPSRMINVNARTYTGGGVSAPGVVGVSGKEPTAVTRDAAQEFKTAKVEEGKARLADDLENLRESFRRLDEMKAIPSTSRNSASNFAAGLQSTGIGQTMGQMLGTKEQVERDVINSARSRLVNSIKNAAGMSAQQLNSNVELKTMLDSISDPKKSVESAMKIIDDIDNAYVKGTGKVPGGGKPSAPSAPAKPAGGVVDFGSLK